MIKIVTDSTADVPKELSDEYNIDIIPLRLVIGKDIYKDGVDINSSEFYEKLRRSSDFPLTKTPPLEDFLEIYQKNIDNFDQIISIHISEKMSRTIEVARLAKKRISTGNDKITIIDSKSASFGLGIQVLELAELKKHAEKLNPQDISNFTENVVDKVRVFFGLSNLDFLKKGGRLGTANELVGSLLGYKPVLAISDGAIIPKGKVKDKSDFPEKLFSMMKDDLKNDKRIKVGVLHWKCETEAQQLKELIEDYFHCEKVYTSIAGSVIGAHTGYGPVGVIYYPI